MRKHLPTALTMLLSCLALLESARAQNVSPYWSLAGNSNAASTSKLGTTNAVDLRMFTNNIERVRVQASNGFVGVGTTAPNARLHINTISGTTPLRVQVASSTRFLVSSNGGAAIGAAGTPPANGLYVGGSVGIGTATPAAKLHVSGSGRFTANLTITDGGLNARSNTGIAVTATGATTGVYGTADGSEDTDIGVYGVGYGYGVKGGGFYYGVYGSGGIGVYGLGDGTGMRGKGYDYGVYGEGSLYGLYGTAYDVGVAGYATNSYGVYGTTGNSDSYAGYFAGNVYATGTYTPSARKLKQNITTLNGAMALLVKLQPKEYEYKQDGNYKLMRLPAGRRYGLIAEEVEQVLPGLVKDTKFDIAMANASDAQVTKQVPQASETIDFKAVNYTELIPILIKGMQEQQQTIETLEKKAAEVDELKERLQKLETLVAGNNAPASVSASLEQNIPNPVMGSTTIRYHVPESSASAILTLTNAKGQIMKTLNLTNRGTGQINVNGQGFASGTYNYTLYVDGKPVDTRRLIIAK